MYRRRTILGGLALLSLLVALGNPVVATTGIAINWASQEASTVAVIGDMPYGDAKVAAFPQFIEAINRDPRVDLVAHLGDIKNGSSPCTDAYFEAVRHQFDRLTDPLVYTPGDNEWTDCHRANNGNWQPTERLDAIRADFFPVAGQTIGGRSKAVLTQADDPAHAAYVENVMWMESKVVFANFNVPGSNDDSVITNPWTGAWAGDPAQAAEQAARDAANLAWLDTTFATADANGAKGIVVMLQADMWDGTHAALDAYDPFVKALGDAANGFGKPVLLLVGDSHIFKVDNPFDGSAAFQAIHPGFTPIAPNVTRIVVEGSTTVANRFEYLRLGVDPKTTNLFSWERVDDTFGP